MNESREPTPIEQEYLLPARLARSRRQRWLVGVSVAVTAVSVGLLVFALISRSHAITAARVAWADSLGSRQNSGVGVLLETNVVLPAGHSTAFGHLNELHSTAAPARGR